MEYVLKHKTLLELAATPIWAIGGKNLGQGGDQETDGHSDRTPEFLCGDGRAFQKDKHQCNTTNQAFMVEWPDGSHSSVKGTTAHLEFAKMHLKDSDH